MERLFLNFIISILTILTPFTSASRCDGSCGGRKIPFPFGFSAGCPIQLNCNNTGAILAQDFAVQSVTGDAVLVLLPPACRRPVEDLRRLFSAYYAPTSHNAFLLRDCRSQSSSCFIPTTMVQTHFDLLGCAAANDTVSCYSSADNRTSFMDYRNLTGNGCRSLFSAISMEPFANSSSVSLDVQTVRLGWWLNGSCRCSKNARCITVAQPRGGVTPAYRCECLQGFAGDGFRDGVGCRRESSSCTPSYYLSGECGGTTRVGALVGGIVAGASLMISLGLIFCCVRKRTKLMSQSRKCRRLYEKTGISVPIYPYKEMEKATNNFSDKRRLGNGAYGTVYSGKLSSNEWVAIKRIKHTDNIEQVINEIKLLSSVSHPNLVRLLGCSIENQEQILAYEFMPNGTLSQHLQREKGTGLPWPVRLRIACETSQAIAYLHNGMHPPIYHRDIKSSNILLDHDFKSKVGDFGLSRLGLMESSYVSTAPQGTPGYLDPQYHQNFHLSDKSDVYSFGVVLVEMITALKAVDFSRPENEVTLAGLAVDRIGRGCLDEIVDPFLKPSLDCSVQKVAELAFRCLAFHREMRPSMMEAAVELEQTRVSIVMDSGVSSYSSSSSSSSSDLSEKPLNLRVEKHEVDPIDPVSCTSSMDTRMEFSVLSVEEDSWRSDKSSPSSHSTMNPIVR